MKLTVLVDNNTIIDRYFLGEPAVSYFIQSHCTDLKSKIELSKVTNVEEVEVGLILEYN